ncbi:unnamed protein product, partial [marine sediment metagenome]
LLFEKKAEGKKAEQRHTQKNTNPFTFFSHFIPIVPIFYLIRE